MLVSDRHEATDMNQSFLLDRQDFSVGHALRAASEHQVEPRQDAVGGGMHPLLLATIFTSPLFWVVLFWWTFS